MRLRFGKPENGAGNLIMEDRSDYDPQYVNREGEKYSRTARHISSRGSFVLNATNAAIGDKFDYASDRAAEVYIHGQEVFKDTQRHEARLRVGNAIFHDGFKRDAIAPVMTVIGVGANSEYAEKSRTLASGAGAVAPGIPHRSDKVDPVLDEHSGIIALRSESEVRVDEANVLRVGDPFENEDLGGGKQSRMKNPGSVIVNGTDQSVKGDSTKRPLFLKNAMLVEVGRFDGDDVTTGRASMVEQEDRKSVV